MQKAKFHYKIFTKNNYQYNYYANSLKQAISKFNNNILNNPQTHHFPNFYSPIPNINNIIFIYKYKNTTQNTKYIYKHKNLKYIKAIIKNL